MTVAGTLEWHSGIAAGALPDAEAVARLVASLKDLAAASKDTGLDKISLEAARASAKIAVVEAKGEQVRLAQAQEFEAQNIAAKNAAMASLIQTQAQGDQQLASIAAKGEQDRLTAAQKAADKLVQIEAQRQAKEAASLAKSSTEKKKAADKDAEQAKKVAEENRKRQAESDAEKQRSDEDRKKNAKDLASMVGAAIKEVAVETAEYLKAGELLAIQETSTRERSLIQLEGLLGSQAQAEDAYTKVLDLANEVGLDRADALAKMNKLITAGFGEEGALAALHAVGDVTEVLGESAGNKLNAVLMKVEAAGKIDVRNISALKSIGVSTDAVYDQLAKSMGKTRQETEALVKAGKVGADVGEKAIEAVIQAKLGGLGTKAGQTVPRLVGDVQDQLRMLFDSIDLGPLKHTLNDVFDLFKGSDGKALKEGVTDLFGALNEALFGGDATKKDVLAELFKNTAKAAHGAADVIRTLAPLIQLAEKFAVGLAYALTTVASVIGSVVGTESGGVGKKATKGPFGGAVSGSTSGGADKAAQEAMPVAPGIVDDAAQKAAAVALGKNIAAGVAQGIQSGQPDARAAMAALVGATLVGGQQAAKVQSPSKLFADELGFHLSAGVGVGVDAGAHLAVASTVDLVQQARAAGAALTGALGVGGVPVGMSPAERLRASEAADARSGGGGVHIHGDVVIHASTESGGREAARGFWDEIRRLAEQVS